MTTHKLAKISREHQAQLCEYICRNIRRERRLLEFLRQHIAQMKKLHQGEKND